MQANKISSYIVCKNKIGLYLLHFIGIFKTN